MSTVTAEIRQASDQRLSDLYCAGDTELDRAIEREAARRDRADQGKRKRDAARSAWYEAAHAQMLAASEACRGHLFHPAVRTAEGAPGQEMQLWTGSEAWARKWASEDLCEWWDAHGGRLSLARWQQQQAAQARAYRDERDLAALAEQVAAAEAAKPRQSARDLAIAAASRPAPKPEGSMAGVIRGLAALTRALDKNTDAWARNRARVNGGKQT